MSKQAGWLTYAGGNPQTAQASIRELKSTLQFVDDASSDGPAECGVRPRPAL